MYYVYLIGSEIRPAHRYVGFTEDLRQRLADHNAGRNTSTARTRPWRLVAFQAFSSRQRAERFLNEDVRILLIPPEALDTKKARKELGKTLGDG